MGVNDTTLDAGVSRVPMVESCANLEQVLNELAGDMVIVVGPSAVAGGGHPGTAGYQKLFGLVLPTGSNGWTTPDTHLCGDPAARPSQHRKGRAISHKAAARRSPRSSPSSTSIPRALNHAHMFLQSRANSSAPCTLPAKSTSCGRSMMTSRSPAASTL